jgi:hypothetical protein
MSFWRKPLLSKYRGFVKLCYILMNLKNKIRYIYNNMHYGTNMIQWYCDVVCLPKNKEIENVAPAWFD